MSNRPISAFIEKNYLHFNAAALVDAAKGYKKHIAEGKKMLVSLAGAMSTGELGISFAEMIRQNKVHIISCTGANLEEESLAQPIRRTERKPGFVEAVHIGASRRVNPPRQA